MANAASVWLDNSSACQSGLANDVPSSARSLESASIFLCFSGGKKLSQFVEAHKPNSSHHQGSGKPLFLADVST